MASCLLLCSPGAATFLVKEPVPSRDLLSHVEETSPSSECHAVGQCIKRSLHRFHTVLALTCMACGDSGDASAQFRQLGSVMPLRLLHAEDDNQTLLVSHRTPTYSSLSGDALRPAPHVAVALFLHSAPLQLLRSPPKSMTVGGPMTMKQKSRTA